MAMSMKSIIFTGGGSAGHVTPNLALISKFQSSGWKITYLGSPNGIERTLIKTTTIPYIAIQSGKLRRYFNWKNFLDPFKVLWGIVQACYWCHKLKPDIVFSKGGYVALPVVVGAWLNRIPIIAHEADLTIGLTNKLCFPLAKKICVTFPETQISPKYRAKTLVTGLPIREEFRRGDAARGRELCQFNDEKKILLIFGGSLGSDRINKIVRTALPRLLPKFQIAHVCGSGKCEDYYQRPGYRQFEYLDREFPHVMAAADIVVARAGANSLYEVVALRKPTLLLPLGAATSRGDQLANAKYAAQRNLAAVLFPHEFNLEKFIEKISWIELYASALRQNMEKFPILDSSTIIYDLACSLTTQANKAGG